LRIEHSVCPATARVRVIFIGTALDDKPPKSIPDEESLGAAWLTVAEMERMRLRGNTLYIAQAVLAGVDVSPLSLLRAS
jgi:phosphatase NudJ